MAKFFEVTSVVKKVELIRADSILEAQMRVRSILQNRNDMAKDSLWTLTTIEEQGPADLPTIDDLGAA